MDIVTRAKEQNQKPKSKLWLLRLIRDVYKDKLAADATADRDGSPHVSMPDFMFEYLKQLYGTRKLVDMNACAVVATTLAYRSKDLHVETFSRFLEEEWGTDVCDIYLKGSALLDDLKQGLSYPVPANDITRVRYCDLGRSLTVANMLLGERHPDAHNAFVEGLERLCTPATESDMKQLRNKQQGSRMPVIDEEYHKIVKSAFLYHLAVQFTAYERGYSDYFHDAFQRGDDNQDGFMTADEFTLLVSEMLPGADQHAVDQMWTHAVEHSLNPAAGHADFKGFAAMCNASELMRMPTLRALPPCATRAS